MNFNVKKITSTDSNVLSNFQMNKDVNPIGQIENVNLQSKFVESGEYKEENKVVELKLNDVKVNREELNEDLKFEEELIKQAKEELKGEKLKVDNSKEVNNRVNKLFGNMNKNCREQVNEVKNETAGSKLGNYLWLASLAALVGMFAF